MAFVRLDWWTLPSSSSSSITLVLFLYSIFIIFTSFIFFLSFLSFASSQENDVCVCVCVRSCACACVSACVYVTRNAVICRLIIPLVPPPPLLGPPPLSSPRLTAAYGIKEHCGREQQLGEALEEHNTGHTNLRDLTSNTHGELFDKGNVWKDSAHYISEAFVEEEGK